MIAKSPRQGTFPKCGLGYGFDLGPLFWECSHPRALPYTQLILTNPTKLHTSQERNLKILWKVLAFLNLKFRPYTYTIAKMWCWPHCPRPLILRTLSPLDIIPHSQKKIEIQSEGKKKPTTKLHLKKKETQKKEKKNNWIKNFITYEYKF